MGKIEIDVKKCKGCGLCIFYCPNKSIILSDKINKIGVKPVAFKKDAKCNACTFCALICPDCAIEVYK
jgi:2-oxoglutarate ferredoxin oxidoreductase subunit delta